MIKVFFVILFLGISTNLYSIDVYCLKSDTDTTVRAYAYEKILNSRHKKEEWHFVYEVEGKAYFFFMSNHSIKYGTICEINIELKEPTKINKKKLLELNEVNNSFVMLFGQEFNDNDSYQILLDGKIVKFSEIHNTFCVSINYSTNITFNLFRFGELYSTYEFNYLPTTKFKFSTLEITPSKERMKKEVFFDENMVLEKVSQTQL